MVLLRHFWPERLYSPYQSLLKLRQTSTVRDYYIDQFVMHARPLRAQAPELLIDLFLNGLKLEVSEECRLFTFQTVDELMELAQKVENQHCGLLLAVVWVRQLHRTSLLTSQYSHWLQRVWQAWVWG